MDEDRSGRRSLEPLQLASAEFQGTVSSSATSEVIIPVETFGEGFRVHSDEHYDYENRYRHQDDHCPDDRGVGVSFKIAPTRRWLPRWELITLLPRFLRLGAWVFAAHVAHLDSSSTDSKPTDYLSRG